MQLAVLPFMVQLVSVVVVCPYIEWRAANNRTTSIANLRVALLIVIRGLSRPIIVFVSTRLVELLLCQCPLAMHYSRTLAQ